MRPIYIFTFILKLYLNLAGKFPNLIVYPCRYILKREDRWLSWKNLLSVCWWTCQQSYPDAVPHFKYSILEMDESYLSISLSGKKSVDVYFPVCSIRYEYFKINEIV